MKPREFRLRSVLSMLAEAQDPLDGRQLRGRVCRDFQIAPTTAWEDVRDLEGRGWVLRQWGRLTITQQVLSFIYPPDRLLPLGPATP